MIDQLENIARECGALVQKMRIQGVTARDKDEARGAHFNTDADMRSEELGKQLLRDTFPNEVVIAEESATGFLLPADCTVFDPLDGTTVYYNSQLYPEHTGRESGVTLCTFRDGQPLYGVIYFPYDQLMISAVRGEGCWLNGFNQGTRITELPWHQQHDKAMVGTDIGAWTSATLPVLASLIEAGYCLRSLIVGVAGARAVLLGETIGYYNLNIAKVWDAAAGVLAITEAGGVATDPWGEPLTWGTTTADWLVARDQKTAQMLQRHTSVWGGRA